MRSTDAVPVYKLVTDSKAHVVGSFCVLGEESDTTVSSIFVLSRTLSAEGQI